MASFNWKVDQLQTFMKNCEPMLTSMATSMQEQQQQGKVGTSSSLASTSSSTSTSTTTLGTYLPDAVNSSSTLPGELLGSLDEQISGIDPNNAPSPPQSLCDFTLLDEVRKLMESYVNATENSSLWTVNSGQQQQQPSNGLLNTLLQSTMVMDNSGNYGNLSSSASTITTTNSMMDMNGSFSTTTSTTALMAIQDSMAEVNSNETNRFFINNPHDMLHPSEINPGRFLRILRFPFTFPTKAKFSENFNIFLLSLLGRQETKRESLLTETELETV